MALVKLNNRGVRSATTFGSITGLGSMVFIKKLTASSSATLSFVDGSASVVLDNTYKEYIFTWKNMHPATDNVSFQFNGSDDDSSHSYDVTKTTTFFQATHNQAGDTSGLAYEGSQDLAQGTGFANLLVNMGNDNDKSANGYLHLFNPSSTTFVKHFISVGQGETHDNYQNNVYTGGYFNTTADITAIQFKFSSGIKLSVDVETAIVQAKLDWKLFLGE